MASLNKERRLNDEEVDYFLHLTSEDISVSLFVDLFARRGPDTPPKYYTNDYFRLPVERFNTKKEVWTTVGIYLLNLHLIQPRFSKLFGYINKPFNGDTIKFIEAKISNEVYYDRVLTDDFADYFNRLQWLGNEKFSLVSPSITPALIKPPPGLAKKKAELFKKYEKELSDDNPDNAIVAAKIEKELIAYATEYLKGQDGYENFEAKAKVNINNHYKTMNIMKGPLLNCYTGKYKVNSSEYNTGISKDEYASFGDSAVLGGYSRAVNTAVGGYQGKQFNQGGNAIAAGPKTSDCGTRKTLDVYLYPEMKKDYFNRYIIDSKTGALIELTPENIDKYTSTTVKMRSPLYCTYKAPCYCNMCLGNQPYLMGIEAFGLTLSNIATKITNLSMKRFHDLTIKTIEIDQDMLFDD